MVNLKAAALVCGVVVTCLGGGLSVACLNSAKVSSANFVEESDTVHDSESEVSQTTAVSADEEKSTTEKKVTTSMATTTKNSKSKKSGNDESSKKEISTAVTTAESTAANAAKVTVPAPVHAPVTKEQVTEPVTETQTETETGEVTTTTADALAAPIPPSTEALTQAPETNDIASTTAPTDLSGTTDVSSIGAGNLNITDEEYIILCNAVANEAGSDWISVYDKARVVEVIMNRVGSELFPNSIYGVLAQPYQFEGAYNYINLGTYSSYVTDSVIEAVNLYFSNPDSFSEGYFYFYGDGYQNHFS